MGYGFQWWLGFFLIGLLSLLFYVCVRDVDILDPCPIRKLMILALGLACASLGFCRRYTLRKDGGPGACVTFFVGGTIFAGFLVFELFALVVLTVEFSGSSPVAKEFVVSRVENELVEFSCADKAVGGVFQKRIGQSRLGGRKLEPGDTITITLFHGLTGYWWYHEKDMGFHFAKDETARRSSGNKWLRNY